MLEVSLGESLDDLADRPGSLPWKLVQTEPLLAAACSHLLSAGDRRSNHHRVSALLHDSPPGGRSEGVKDGPSGRRGAARLQGASLTPAAADRR